MRCFIFLFFFASFSCAVDSLHLSPSLDSFILLDQAKVFKDRHSVTLEQAYALLKEGRFEPLSPRVKSFGVSDATYWMALKLQNTAHEKLFLEFQYDQLAYVDCYIFHKDQLLHVMHNGNAVAFKKREVEHFFVRFALLHSDEPLTYLFKIVSDRPILIAMNIGTKSELDYDKLMTILPITFFTGFLLLLLVLNMMIYGLFKSREYLYYSMYLVSFFVFIMYINNYIFFLTQEHLGINTFIKVVSAQGFHIALLLFTLSCLEIHRFSLFLVHLTYCLCVCCFVAFLCLSLHGAYQTIAILAGLIIPFYCLGLSLYAWKKKIEYARLYAVGLVGFCIGALLFWLMQIGLIEVIDMGKNTLLVGSLWEMILFAAILLLKIKSIKTQYSVMKFHMDENEQERLHQSKYISIGRSIGNVAHQWKQPLNALGAILTHMKGSLLLEQRIRKSNLVKSLDMSFDILKHLSETIDTFYNFLLKPYAHKSQFNVMEELESIQKMLAFSFKNSGITLRFFTNTNSSIVGNPNEFIQVVLNILLNAQDQFNTCDHSNALIDISINEVNETCIITIQDNAGGVTIEPIEQIFDLHVSSKSAGAGIGLFICKSIIEKRFNGTIEVVNQHNGACFKIFIPLNVA